MRQKRRTCAAFVLALLATASAQLAAQTRPEQAREQGAATRSQAEQTERANRAATVADETGTIHGSPVPAPAGPARPAAGAVPRQEPPLPPPYGPVLYPRGQPPAGTPAGDAARKHPAEVHDEADTLTRPAAPPGSPPPQPGAAAPRQVPQQAPQQSPQQQQAPQQKPQQQAARRHPAWQGQGAPAPRPLHPADGPASAGLPIPAPAPAPQAPPRGSTIVNGCQGSFCTDATGNSYNAGSNGTAISSGGRLCTRGTATVQCL